MPELATDTPAPQDAEEVDPARSAIMSRVRTKHTQPEMIVRRLLHSEGYRYRLHASDLPGRPDIVFRRKRKAIFVHGCFWHRHEGCARATLPKTRISFWKTKFQQNQVRDAQNLDGLRRAGWDVLVVWECETTKPDLLWKRLDTFMRAAMCVGRGSRIA